MAVVVEHECKENHHLDANKETLAPCTAEGQRGGGGGGEEDGEAVSGGIRLYATNTISVSLLTHCYGM